MQQLNMPEIIVKIKADDIVTLHRKLNIFDFQNDDIEIVSYTHDNKTYKFDKNNKPKDWLKKAKQGQWADKEN